MGAVFEQWISRLNEFVIIHEDLIKGRKTKKFKSCIGKLTGGKDKLTGIIDVAMVSSIKEKTYPKLDGYGMVIYDECHHCTSDSSREVFSHISSHYVYGMTATSIKDDSLTPILGFTFGPIRYQYTSYQRA